MNTVDVVIFNAVIWSAGEILPHTALATDGQKVVALGGEELQHKYDARELIDAQGGLVTPSFADAHIHAVFGGVEMNRCDMSECESADEVYEAIAEYASSHPDEEWILGAGWRMPFFEGGTPLKEDLDRVVPDRPVFLINADHHGAWANSLAFELAGITADTPDPEDGRIERDKSGVPSGTLQEGAADLVGAVIPETTLHEAREGLAVAQQRLFSKGITGWQEAILGEYAGYPDLTEVYHQMVGNGELKARVSGALWVSRDFDDMTIPEFVDQLVERRAAFGSELFDLNTAKIMIDGVSENETAAMSEPYLSECSCAKGNGLSYFSREELIELIPMLNKRGFNAHCHAIGDRAVKYALDAIEAVPAEIRANVNNHVAHIQVVDPLDIPRFAQLDVTANMQMLWAANDDQMVDLTLPILGEKRVKWQYPFGSLLKSGATVVCGSDWPVSTPDPWQAVHVGVTRQESGSTEREPLLPSEALTLNEALAAYTLGSHTLLGGADGRIGVGSSADLAIANRNPFDGPDTDIHLTKNRVTLLRGEVVYRVEE